MHDCLTWGFVQMGLDKQTSANCKSRLWFGLAKIAGWLSLLESCIKITIFNTGSPFCSPAARIHGCRQAGTDGSLHKALSLTVIFFIHVQVGIFYIIFYF